MYVSISLTVGEKTKYEPMQLNQKYNIELNQQNGYFSFALNGNMVWNVTSGGMHMRSSYERVQFWLSDKWYPSAGQVAVMKNLKLNGEYQNQTVVKAHSSKP